MPKNIVVCCDGTSNEYGSRNTNVVKLFSVLTRDTHSQVALYDPGVGTLTGPALITKPVRIARWVVGLAFGYGIMDNIRDAYRYIMQVYEPGDRIYLFGFSRGAYTARAVAALINKCGLLMPHNESLIPYAMKMFKHNFERGLWEGFRDTFAQKVPVHFLGLWDTVSSVGWVYDPVTLPFTRNNESVRAIRHAIAIDERRCYFRQNTWNALASQDCVELWFPGSHCDVGGGYPMDESGLSQVAFKWMLDEAMAHGLLVNPAKVQQALEQAPDPNGVAHKSLAGVWWIPEVLPKLYYDGPQGDRKKLMIPLGRRRTMLDGVVLHPSCRARSDYRPPNLPQSHTYWEASQAQPVAAQAAQ